MKRCATLLLAVLLGGCAEDETAILLSVCTNIDGDQADVLRLEFTTEIGGNVVEDAREILFPDTGLPGSVHQVSLRPGKQFNRAFTISASLLKDDELVVTRRITAQFVDGEDRDARIFLDSDCIGQFCGAAQSCDHGSCQPVGTGTDACGPGGQDGGPDGGGCDDDRDQYAGCGGPDCDDDDPDVHPDARELCDQVDNDCSGEADDGLWLAGEEDFASLATTDEQAPALAWGEGAYGVTWRATRACLDDVDCDGLTCVDGQCPLQELRFVGLVPGEETPPDTAQVILTGEEPYAGEPSIAWSGVDWGIAYEDGFDGPLDVYFARVDVAGVPIGEPQVISFGQAGAFSPALAWSGRTFGAVWSEVVDGNTALEFAQIDSEGVTGGASITAAGEDAYSGALDWGDNQFGIAWVGGDGVVSFQLASEQGVQNGSTVSVSEQGALVGTTVDVSWAGDGWVVVWEQYEGGVSGIQLARLDPEGVLERAPEQVVQTGHTALSPDLAWSGVELAVAWADGDEGDARILVQRLSADGVPQGAPVRMIAGDPARGSRPSVSWNADGGEYGVVWQDQRLQSDIDVWFNRLHCDDGT